MPYTPDEALARAILEPYVSKPLSRKGGLALTQKISNLIRGRVRAMLTYGPQEIARIAEREKLSPDRIATILSAAGGHITDAAGVEAAWEIDLDTKPDFLADGREAIAKEIHLLLHASRDGMRNKGVDTKRVTFAMQEDAGYYNEAFGLVRALNLLGYGHLGGNIRHDDAMNLQTWFRKLQEQVLQEEGFDGDNTCLYCLERYGKDSNGAKSVA